MKQNISVKCKFGFINLAYCTEGSCYLLHYGTEKNPSGALSEEEVNEASMEQLVALVEKSQSQENPFLR